MIGEKQLGYIEFCKRFERQQQIRSYKGMTLEELTKVVGNADDAKTFYDALKSSREGYFRIRKIKPSLGDEKEGWSYAFAENMPLHIDNPERWYSTSNVTKINWDEGTFETMNSVYSFEMVKNC